MTLEEENMSKAKSNRGVYDENSIRVMKGLDGVRKRPSMYIGDIGPDGFNHLVMEIIDNSVDEAVAGFAKRIKTTYHKDGSITVEDDGRGIPVGKHPTEKIPTVDVVMTMLHAGGKFGGADSPFKTSGGLHGVGAAVVNALSEWMEVRVKRDRKQFYRRYVNGKPNAKTLKIEKRNLGKRDTGTIVTFMPDKSIFAKGVEFSEGTITRRLRELAFLNAGVEFTLDWYGKTTIFKSEGGLREYVEYLANGKKMAHNPIRISCDDLDGCSVDLAFVYDEAYDSEVRSFANNIPTIEGGVHHNAALDSLCKVIANLSSSMRDIKKGVAEPNKGDVMEGLNLIVSVRVAEPQFGGQTKTKLGNNELRTPLGMWMQEALEKQFRSKRDIAKIVITKVIEAMAARDAARKAKSLTRKKSVIETLTLPGKLSDCTSKDPELCEIYIVEGACFAQDTLIHTKDGLKRLDEIENGDMIYTHMHRYRPARVRKPKIKRKKVRITLQGRTFVCSRDHLFLVLRISEKDKKEWTEWCRAKDLKKTDLVVKTALVNENIFDASEVIRRLKT